MICLASIEGCADCEREDKYKESIGHRCGPSDRRFSTLCEIRREARIKSPEFHRLAHLPVRCEDCRAILDDHLGNCAEEFRVCPSGRCSQSCCRYCGGVQSSWGPLDCPTCGSLGRRPKITRLRQQYREKKGRWRGRV